MANPAVLADDTVNGKLTVNGSLELLNGYEKLYWGSKHDGTTDHRNYLAPTNPDGSGYDWDQEFGFHHHYRAWYFEGNLGIGTHNPNHKLDVNGSIQSTANYGLLLSPSSGDAVLRRGTPGHLMISSGGNTSDIRFNYNYGGGSGGIAIFDGGTTNYARLKVNETGSLNIWSKSGKIAVGGVFAPSYTLDVNGTIRADEIIVSTEGADFVFEDSYKLPSLTSIEEHIAQNGHLPGVPSASTMRDQGVAISELQTILLQKVEELTLHMIEKEKQISELQKLVRSQQTRIQSLEATGND